jgi:TRAP-type C4-dicarboxylate transport system substrate-binding protein
LYKDAAQATAVFSRLVASGTIRDFKDYFVIGAFAGEPESIHTRSPVASLADLKDKRIRANNSTEIDIFKKLSISPVFVPLNETAQIISGGKVDGAAAPPVPTIEFGIGRVAPNHYFLRTSCIPQVLLMTRKRFGSLPGDIQSVISKYSGTWFADHYTRINETSTAQVMNQLESDPKRKVVFPSPADTEKVKAIFNSIVDDYAARNPHNAELVKAARAIISKVNSSTEVPQ